jgi:rare lipoprotein A
MRVNRKTTTALLALIAGTGCIACSAADAFAAASGGSVAPIAGAPTGSPAPGKVHATGIATWFGPGFYGSKTACGQTLTPGVIGVANRTLPCGTLVKVSYAGHALTVPVLDRGPYSHIGADWDLTAGAAQALGISDTVRIGTRVVGSAPNTPTLGLLPGSQSPALAGGAVAG